MGNTQLASNPFALLVDPQAVMAIIERSERLARLHSRVCRPLDKPLIAHAPAGAEDFDQAVDATPDDVEADVEAVAE